MVGNIASRFGIVEVQHELPLCHVRHSSVECLLLGGASGIQGL